LLRCASRCRDKEKIARFFNFGNLKFRVGCGAKTARTLHRL
jgi:hypothetical protein